MGRAEDGRGGVRFAGRDRCGRPGAGLVRAEDITRGSVTGQTPAKGFDHPGQYLHVAPVKIADNMEPVIVHAEQDKQARQKLAALEKRFGRKPNILVFIMDDVGWLDPGFNGGGEAVGNPTPNLDRLAHAGLILTSAYSTPSCTPTRATIHLGQNPLHHGLLRPPMYGEPGGLDGAVTVASVLQKLGYVTQGVGKWHMGENEGSLPQNVGYDDFYGFLGVSDMYTEWRDIYFNPEIALSPSRFAMMEKLPFNRNNVHCVKGKKGVENVYEINLTTIAEPGPGLGGLQREVHPQDGQERPAVVPVSRDAGRPLRQLPQREVCGKIPGADRLQRRHGRGGRHFRPARWGAGGDRADREHADRVHLGQRPGRGGPAAWPLAVPRLQGILLGGRRAGAHFRLLEGRDRPAEVGRAVRSGGPVQHQHLHRRGPGAEVAKYLPQDRYVDGIDQASFLIADNGLSNRRSRIYTLNEHPLRGSHR